MGRISLLAEEFLAPQEGLCSMQLVNGDIFADLLQKYPLPTCG
jgi:hypothetical protein